MPCGMVSDVECVMSYVVMWNNKCSAKCGGVLWNVVRQDVVVQCAVMWNTLRCDVEWRMMQNDVIQMCSKMWCTVECCDLNLVWNVIRESMWWCDVQCGCEMQL